MTPMTNSQARTFYGRSFATLTLLAALAVLLALVLPSGLAWANTTGSDDMLRVSDFTASLTDEEKSELSRMAKNEVDDLEFDFVAVIDDTDTSVSQRAKGFYENNNFGYGDSDDGIILYVSTKTGKAGIYTCGLGTKVFSDKDVKSIRKAVKSTMGSSYYDAIYLFFNSAVCQVSEYRGVSVGSNWSAETAVGATASSSSGGSETAAGSGDASTASGKTTKDLSWYPKDPSKFKDFHNDSSVSRVVDNADLLTDDEEEALAARIADMQERTGLDFVLCTDTSSYGLSREVFAADFYQFNGYGFDDEYSGVIYFVCMEDGNRGFWTAACGSARELLTEDNVNAMDDATYSYFVSGEYGKAISTQFDNLDYLYTNGSLPFDWRPFILGGFVGCVAGVVYGFVRLRRRLRLMKTVEKATGAGSYVAHGPNYRVKHDKNLGTTVNRVKRHEDTGGGGSSGGSSYSGSYSSSGGRSFSGGGRSF